MAPSIPTVDDWTPGVAPGRSPERFNNLSLYKFLMCGNVGTHIAGSCVERNGIVMGGQAFGAHRAYASGMGSPVRGKGRDLLYKEAGLVVEIIKNASAATHLDDMRQVHITHSSCQSYTTMDSATAKTMPAFPCADFPMKNMFC